MCRPDLDRIDAIWSRALDRSGGPFLYGAYTLADAFYAPVATRIATYTCRSRRPRKTYVEAHLAQPEFRRWRAMGLAEGPELPQYDMPLDRCPFPSPDTARPPGRRTGPRKTRSAPIPANPSRIWRRSRPHLRLLQRLLPGQDRRGPRAWPAFMQAFTIRKRFARSR
jgi:glutathione S-transferase